MIQVLVNAARQRIDMKINQQVNEGDILRVLSELKAGVRSMRPGWTMATDLRGLVVVNPALNHHVAEIQKTVAAASPGKFGTLVDSQVLKLQLRMDAKTVQNNGSMHRFDNEKEWRAFVGNP